MLSCRCVSFVTSGDVPTVLLGITESVPKRASFAFSGRRVPPRPPSDIGPNRTTVKTAVLRLGPGVEETPPHAPRSASRGASRPGSLNRLPQGRRRLQSLPPARCPYSQRVISPAASRTSLGLLPLRGTLTRSLGSRPPLLRFRLRRLASLEAHPPMPRRSRVFRLSRSGSNYKSHSQPP